MNFIKPVRWRKALILSSCFHNWLVFQASLWEAVQLQDQLFVISNAQQDCPIIWFWEDWIDQFDEWITRRLSIELRESRICWTWYKYAIGQSTFVKSPTWQMNHKGIISRVKRECGNVVGSSYLLVFYQMIYQPNLNVSWLMTISWSMFCHVYSCSQTITFPWSRKN
jgi:hypothetical protein